MFVFLYGVSCYALFVVTLLYAIGFVENLFVPKSIDTGPAGPVWLAVLVNSLLLGAFAVQHTIMARPAFKKWITRYIPQAAERSTFVLATCICFWAMFLLWRPIPGVIWSVESEAARLAVYGLSFAGFGLVLYASFLIDHFDLFGLRQVVLHLRGRKYTHTPFQTPLLYRLVRNPLMLGFLIAFWAAPTMTWGRLLFCLLTTGYIFVGVWFEERDLERFLGEPYRQYRRRTPMLLPWPRPKATPEGEATALG